MPYRVVDAEVDRRQRQVRARMARLRSRIDRHIDATRSPSRRMVSWRTYVQGYPASALAAAMGVGLALSAGLSARRLAGWLGMRLIRRAADTAGGQLWRELAQLWADSTPGHAATPTPGADHD